MTTSDEKKRSILVLYNDCGESISSISRKLQVDRYTIRKLILTKGEVLNRRRDKINIDDDLLRDTFLRCNKWAERTHEELQEMGIKIGYSTLTRRIRELGLRKKEKKLSEKYADVPGEEFQHDTSPYTVAIDKKKTKDSMFSNLFSLLQEAFY